jgi:hypothetical protein
VRMPIRVLPTMCRRRLASRLNRARCVSDGHARRCGLRPADSRTHRVGAGSVAQAAGTALSAVIQRTGSGIRPGHGAPVGR